MMRNVPTAVGILIAATLLQHPAGAADLLLLRSNPATHARALWPAEARQFEPRQSTVAPDDQRYVVPWPGGRQHFAQAQRDEAGSAAPRADYEPSSSSSLRLTPETAALRQRVREALDLYRPQLYNTRDNNPWEVMHAFVAFGVETEVRKGGPQGDPVTAIGWLCFNGRCRGQNLLYLRPGGIGAKQGAGTQGHGGQFLALLAQSRVRTEYPLKVEGKEFTVTDLIRFEQETCQPGTELTFKLIGLTHYLGTTASWENEYGRWDVERLIREELAQPIRGATCGGTHRLFGLSYAVKKRIYEGEPVTGQFHRADKFIRDYHDYAFSLQNSDGSMSTDFFKGRGNSGDPDRNLNTTGHVLEWLAFSLPQVAIQDARVIKAFDFLSRLLIEGSSRRWSIGPRGHALHALALYEERLANLDRQPPDAAVAEKPKTAPATP